MTIATLTGHACLAVGDYSIVMDNSVAQRNGNGTKLQAAGHQIGDPFEISILRREDIAFHKGQGEGDDVHQCNNLPSSRTARGHQGPAGFLILTSGLDQVLHLVDFYCINYGSTINLIFCFLFSMV